MAGGAAGDGTAVNGSQLQAAETARRVEISLGLPQHVVPGKTQLRVGVGNDTELVMTVPEQASAEDRLVLVPSEDDDWKCNLRSGGMCVGGDVLIEVPENAIGGYTILQADAADHSGWGVQVPLGALPGDNLAVKVLGGNEAEVVSILRDGTPSVIPDMSDDAAVLTDVTLSHVAVDPQLMYQNLVASARAAGGFMSEKMDRAIAPPLNMVGMVATADIEAGEELMRMPSKLHFSNATAQAFNPSLYNAVRSAPGLMDRFRRDSAIAACLARLIKVAQGRVSNGRAAAPGASALHVWSCYCDALAGEDFTGHPYWKAIEDLEKFKAEVYPSNEAVHAQAMSQEVLTSYNIIQKHAAAENLGGDAAFDAGTFLHARLAMLSRVFHTSAESTLVPVVDLFNHSSDAGVDWEWRPHEDAMVVTAGRAHKKGEQLFISYGRRANPLLFRTYGFTLPPDEEPSWSFLAGRDACRELFQTFLPASWEGSNIFMDSRTIEEIVIEAMNDCTKQGHNAGDFLRKLCEQMRAPYETHESLKPALEALQRARSKDPTSYAWWTEYRPAEGSERIDLSDCAAATPLRLCMSEYLCLTAHLEAVDVAEGKRTIGECFANCTPLTNLMVDCLRELKQRGAVKLKTVPAVAA